MALPINQEDKKNQSARHVSGVSTSSPQSSSVMSWRNEVRIIGLPKLGHRFLTFNCDHMLYKYRCHTYTYIYCTSYIYTVYTFIYLFLFIYLFVYLFILNMITNITVSCRSLHIIFRVSSGLPGLNDQRLGLGLVRNSGFEEGKLESARTLFQPARPDPIK